MNNLWLTLLDQFLKERTYLKNVTRATLRWYRIAFKSYGKGFLTRCAAPDRCDASAVRQYSSALFAARHESRV